MSDPSNKARIVFSRAQLNLLERQFGKPVTSQDVFPGCDIEVLKLRAYQQQVLEFVREHTV